MDILWASPVPLKPADVLKSLKDQHAYTTVMTVLKRMADKKLVKRKISGNVYFYTPSQDKASFASDCLDDLFVRLFNSYGDFAVSSFKKVAKDSGLAV
jgi:predicted transcriptional regulator